MNPYSFFTVLKRQYSKKNLFLHNFILADDFIQSDEVYVNDSSL